MIDNGRQFDGVLAALADGRPIDWRSFEAEADESQRRLLANARLVAAVITLYRSNFAVGFANRPSVGLQVTGRPGHV